MRIFLFIVVVLVIVIAVVMIRRRSRTPNLIHGPARDVRRAIIDQYADANHQRRTDIIRPVGLDTRLEASVFDQFKNIDPQSSDAYALLDQIVDSVQNELIAIDEDLWPAELISEPRRIVHIIYWLELEINNGGFTQYYINSAGDYAAETPDALRKIDLDRFAEFVEQANSFFSDGPPRDRKVRLAVYDEVEDRAGDTWSGLDTQYFESGIDCCPAIVAYVLEHPGEFFQV